METVQLRNAYGAEMIIPEGAKAFATDFTLTSGPQRIAQKINPIEWCAFLPGGINGRKPGPQSVCIFWQGEQRASYTESEVGEFAFLPGLPPFGHARPRAENRGSASGFRHSLHAPTARRRDDR